MTSIRRFPDAAALARGAADEFAGIARASRGTCNIALSGGSTPKGMFQILAKLGRDALPWDRIELWWGDERCVPPDHPDSNYGMTKANLIDPLKLEPARIHRIEGEREPEAAARDYERALTTALGTPPIFDLVLLGMGPDGHTASLFPGSAGLAERTRSVIANVCTSPLVVRTAPPSGGAAGPGQAPAGAGTATRIAVTFPVINAAHHVRFLVGGADKAETLAAVLEGPRGKYPAQNVDNADLVWLVDDAAAVGLHR